MRKGVFSISIPVELAEFLDDYCAAKKMKRSHVVAEALRRMMQKEKQKLHE